MITRNNSLMKVLLFALTILTIASCKKKDEGSIFIEVEDTYQSCYKILSFNASVGPLFHYLYPSEVNFKFDKYYKVVAGTFHYDYYGESSCVTYPPISFEGDVTLVSNPGTSKQIGKSNYYDLNLNIEGGVLTLHKAPAGTTTTMNVDTVYMSNGNKIHIKGKYTIGAKRPADVDQALK